MCCLFKNQKVAPTSFNSLKIGTIIYSFQFKTITLALKNACAFLPVLAQCATGVCRCKAAGVLAWKLEAGGQSRRAVASEQLPPASKKAKIFVNFK